MRGRRKLSKISLSILYFAGITSSAQIWKCTGPLSKLDDTCCQRQGHTDKDGCYYVQHFSQFRSCATLCENVEVGSISESRCMTYCPTYFSHPSNICTRMSPGEVTTESMTIRTPMPQPTPTNASVSNVSYKKPAVTSALAVTFSLLFILTVIVFVCSWLKKNKRKPSRSTSRESNNDLEMNNSRSNDNSLIDSEGTPFIDGSESYSVSCTDTNSRLDSVQYEPNPRPSTPVQESGTLHSGDASPSLTAGTKLTVDMTPNNSVTSHPCTSTSASHCPPAGSRHAERDRSLTSTPLSFASSSQTDSSGHSRAGTSIVCTGEFSEQDPGPPVPLQTPTFDPVAPSSPVDSGKS